MQTLKTVGQERSAKKPARLGQINFINSLPVVIPTLRRASQLQADIVMGTPSELNNGYEQGKLDLGAMSSFFFLKFNAMQLIKGVSISSVGEVGSVLFFSKRELKDLDQCRIAVPLSSATSINLLKVLLKELYCVTPVLVTDSKPDITDPSLDGALVIGDRALIVDEEWRQNYLRMDMGAWWYEAYRLPMTFGVWAARNEWIKNNPENFQDLSRQLASAAGEGLSLDFDAVLAESMKRLPLTRERLERYFKNELNFEFSVNHERGLHLYRDLCRKNGLIV